jgi:hypothetical protein
VGEVVVHRVVPLSCFIDLPYITDPQAAKQAAKICCFVLKTKGRNGNPRIFNFDYAQKGCELKNAFQE